MLAEEGEPPGKEFPFFIRVFVIHSIPQLNADIGQNSRSSENKEMLRKAIEFVPSNFHWSEAAWNGVWNAVVTVYIFPKLDDQVTSD